MAQRRRVISSGMILFPTYIVDKRYSYIHIYTYIHTYIQYNTIQYNTILSLY